MPEDNFLQRKKDVLFKLDKSSKGTWDKRILGLCTKINSSNDYYTTSSCSGRVVLILDEEKKQEGLFIKIYHDEISFEQLKNDLREIVKLCLQAHDINADLGSLQSRLRLIVSKSTRNLARVIDWKLLSTTKSLASPDFSETKSVNRKDSSINFKKFQVNVNERGKLIKFKLEPCILHVACRDLNCAQKLFDKAKFVGWKKSGIIATKNHIMLELNSTEKLEFPIIHDGEILVDDKFLKIIVNESNKKLEKSWLKIQKLHGLI